jgi:hypothetical protein
MLVLPEYAAVSTRNSWLTALPDDTSWELVVPGSASLMTISAIAFHILQFPPIHAFCWAAVAFTSGFLARKSIGHYNFSRSITRDVLTFDDRIPYARVIAFSIALVVSFVFPTIAAIFAAAVGACAGYLFRPQHRAS